MKLSKAVKLKDDLVIGHDIFLVCDPFVSQGLLDVLKFLDFKADPMLNEILNILPTFQHFGYRTRSKRIPTNGEGKVEALSAYHEGFHNLVELRFGSKLQGRPMMILLNETLGTGLQVYFMAKLAAAAGGVRPIKSALHVQPFLRAAKLLDQSFDKIFGEAVKNPFAVYRETAMESYSIHKMIFEALRKFRGQPENWASEFVREMSSAKNFLFFSHFDLMLPALFVAENSGLKSCSEDLRSTEKCLEYLHKANNMEDFLIELGIEKVLPKRSRQSA